MTTYLIIAGVIAAAVAFAVFLVMRSNRQARELGRQEVIQQVQHADAVAIEKADKVLAETRTVDDTVDRLRNNNF